MWRRGEGEHTRRNTIAVQVFVNTVEYAIDAGFSTDAEPQASGNSEVMTTCQRDGTFTSTVSPMSISTAISQRGIAPIALLDRTSFSRMFRAFATQATLSTEK